MYVAEVLLLTVQLPSMLLRWYGNVAYCAKAWDFVMASVYAPFSTVFSRGISVPVFVLVSWQCVRAVAIV